MAKQGGGSSDWVLFEVVLDTLSIRSQSGLHFIKVRFLWKAGLGPEECSVTEKGVISNMDHLESVVPDRLRHRWDPRENSKMLCHPNPGPS